VNTQRKPIFGTLAVVLPLAGYLIASVIVENKKLTERDYSGLVQTLLILIWGGSCLLLGTAFGIVSLARREAPKWVAWTGLGITWVPIVGIAVVAGVSKVSGR